MDLKIAFLSFVPTLCLIPKECFWHRQIPLRSLHNTKSISLFNFPSFLCTGIQLPVMQVCAQKHVTCLILSHNHYSIKNKHPPTSSVSNIHALTASPSLYLRQPAVLVSAVSHSRWRGLQLSSPPSFPLSQPECGTITSSDSAWSAWSTISIFTESWDERFHRVPGRERMTSHHDCKCLFFILSKH